MLLYLGPNLVQDLHRIFGHPIQFGENHNLSDIQLFSHADKCPVCVFEFNIVEESKTFEFIPFLKIETFILETVAENQIQNTYFYYYNLRGPPQS